MLYSLVPLVIMAGIGFFVFTQMQKMKGGASGAAATYDAERARLQGVFAGLRQSNESDAVFVGVGTNQLTGNRQFYVALTNQRLLLDEAKSGAPMRTFDRKAIQIQGQRKTWNDQGNMQTTVSEGSEILLGLPSESHTLRLYDSNPYDPAHAVNAKAFMRELGQA
jgi:hypothetical protein